VDLGDLPNLDRLFRSLFRFCHSDYLLGLYRSHV
jgi:hypothetical protein